MSVTVRPPTPASRSRTVIARMLESFQERSSVWGGCGDRLVARVVQAPVRGGRGSPVVGALVSLWASGLNRGDNGQHCDERDVELCRGLQPPPALHRDGQRLTRCRGDGVLAFGGVAVLGGEPHIHVLPGAVAEPVRKIQPDGA